MKIRKLLNILALQNAEGKVSDVLLEKACNAYKIKSNIFLDDYNYHICVTKTLYDYLNGLKSDQELCKAIIPGQTKVVDGVMYIYTATPNAKTDFDWRVYKGNKKIGRQISDQKSVNSKQKYINELFPYNLSSLKTIKSLPGSTGAKLVEDAQGNQYVMKRGKNTSNDHIKTEYLANQLYDLLGQRVPDCELYDDNGESVLLSKFISLARASSSEDYDAMAKGFVVDSLLANWDVYQNDNCIVDSAGRVIRVDNGGALNYRAQGGTKLFGAKLIDFDSMRKYNSLILANLTTQDYINQIDEVLTKKDDVLNYLEQISNSLDASIFDSMKGRFKDLQNIKNALNAELLIKSGQPTPRQLKDDEEMYRIFSDEEMIQLWNSVEGKNYDQKLRKTDQSTGWELLSNICEKRGFNARPEVVDEATYWNAVKQSKYQMFRGLAPTKRRDAKYFADAFKYNDTCFYGTIGLYGSGIYAFVNDGNNSNNTLEGYTLSDAYINCVNDYATQRGEVLFMCLDPSAKIATVEDLHKEILSLIPPIDQTIYETKLSEINQLKQKLDNAQKDLNEITSSIENKLKEDMHWNEDVLVTFQQDIDNTDWEAITHEGIPDYPDWNTFVVNKMFNWVRNNGGTVREKGKDTDVYIFTLPNSKESFMLTRYQWENNAIKRKNQLAKAYNYPLKRFQDWLMNNHYNIILKAIRTKTIQLKDKINDAKNKVSDINDELIFKTNELNDLKTVKEPNKSIINGICASVSRNDQEAIGVYAALKGYDAIIQPHGNGGANSFMIILNRSKVICKK